jgi:hypothetical protein
MANIAWYKLDGNANESLNNYTGTASGTVTFPSGKIAQSAFFNTGRIDTNIPDSITGTMSISLWFKKTTDNWAMSIGVIGTRNGDSGWMLYRNSGDTAGFFRWYMHYNNTSGTVSQYYPWPGISGLTHNRWYHFTIIRESNGASRLYVDGNIVANLVPPANFSSWRFTAVNVGIAAERAGSGSWNGTTQEIDDVKMYDHVLSDYEIKELAKAKILHYTFNNEDEEPTQNLFINPTFEANITGISAGMEFTVTHSNERAFGGNFSVKSVRSSTSTNGRSFVPATTGVGYAASTTYTASCMAFVEQSHTATTLQISEHSGTTTLVSVSTYDMTKKGTWQRIHRTFTINGTGTLPILVVESRLGTITIGDTFFIDNFQIERKNYPTNFTDSIRNIGIADSSGYINAGTTALATAPNIVNTSKIGSNTINFNSGNNMTLVDSGQLNLQDYTYSFWIKLKNGFTGGFRRFLGRSGSGSDRSPGFWFLHTTNGIHLQQKLSNGGNGGPGDITPITLNEWHHVVMSCEFVNGNTVLKRWFNYSNFNSTTAASVSPLLLSTANLIFQADSANYEMDDFRVYATPLSDADVKALYEKRANLDNQGNVQVDEIITSNMIPVSEGLKLHLNPNHISSYPGTGTSFKDLTDNRKHFLLDASGIVHNSNGYFVLNDGGMIISPASAITTSSTATVVFWIKTTDTQALFLEGQTTSHYLGAYSSGNKYYNNSVGSPSLFIDTVSRVNLFDFLLDNKYHMVEFKGANLSTWTNFRINKYGSFTFGSNTELGEVMIFDRIITSEESAALYNYFINGNRDFKHQRSNFNALGQAIYTDIDEVTGTQNTGAQQEIKDNGTLFINGEFSEVD